MKTEAEGASESLTGGWWRSAELQWILDSFIKSDLRFAPDDHVALTRFSHTVLRQGRLGRRRHLRGDFLRSNCPAAGMLGSSGVVLGCDGAFWASQGL